MNTATINIRELRASCSSCTLKELCLPLGFSPADLEMLDGLISIRKTIKRGQYLFRSGDRFEALYAIRYGFMKSMVLMDDGREQVTGFHMMGEIIGLDGIGSERHSCDLLALDDTEVCVMQYSKIEELTQRFPQLQSNLHKIMSREIVSDHSVMLLLGSFNADERLAAFLINLSQRFKARGYSSAEFILRMTRAEIGSYLGMKLETVSRVLSRFQDEGLLQVNQKSIRIDNMDGLKALLKQGGSCA